MLGAIYPGLDKRMHTAALRQIEAHLAKLSRRAAPRAPAKSGRPV